MKAKSLYILKIRNINDRYSDVNYLLYNSLKGISDYISTISKQYSECSTSRPQVSEEFTSVAIYSFPIDVGVYVDINKDLRENNYSQIIERLYFHNN